MDGCRRRRFGGCRFRVIEGEVVEDGIGVGGSGGVRSGDGACRRAEGGRRSSQDWRNIGTDSENWWHRELLDPRESQTGDERGACW